MPARFVYWMNVSLDLFIERAAGTASRGATDSGAADDLGATGDHGGASWIGLGEPLHREFNRRAAGLTAMVQGRVVHEMMDPFWPDARTDLALPAYLREYGEIWTTKPKLLVSRTRTEAGHDTKIIGGDEHPDAIVELAELRQTGSGDIGVGGANLATQLLNAHLLDELLLFTHPVVLGKGRPLFDSLDEPLELDLLEQRTFDQGVTMHRYQVRRAV